MDVSAGDVAGGVAGGVTGGGVAVGVGGAVGGPVTWKATRTECWGIVAAFSTMAVVPGASDGTVNGMPRMAPD